MTRKKEALSTTEKARGHRASAFHGNPIFRSFAYGVWPQMIPKDVTVTLYMTHWTQAGSSIFVPSPCEDLCSMHPCVRGRESEVNVVELLQQWPDSP